MMDNPQLTFVQHWSVLQMVLKTVLMADSESWDRRWRIDATRVMRSRVAMFPGSEFHCPSRSS